jgi:hypothetical protein
MSRRERCGTISAVAPPIALVTPGSSELIRQTPKIAGGSQIGGTPSTCLAAAIAVLHSRGQVLNWIAPGLARPWPLLSFSPAFRAGAFRTSSRQSPRHRRRAVTAEPPTVKLQQGDPPGETRPNRTGLGYHSNSSSHSRAIILMEGGSQRRHARGRSRHSQITARVEGRPTLAAFLQARAVEMSWVDPRVGTSECPSLAWPGSNRSQGE